VIADAVLALVAEQHGVVIGLEGPCPGGENGAFYGRCTDGRRVVFKWSEETDAADRLPTLVGALRRLHGSGYPLPLYGPAFAVAGAPAYDDLSGPSSSSLTS
jgi:hypothetical protein